MDATLAFALRNFQAEQTEAMQAEVAKIQAERAREIEAVTLKHRAHKEHLQARAVALRGTMSSIESVQPRLDAFCTEVLAAVVEGCKQKLEAAEQAAGLAQRTRAGETAEQCAAVLQIELAESTKFAPEEEVELKQLLALLAPGDDVVVRLAAAEAIMLGTGPMAGPMASGGAAGPPAAVAEPPSAARAASPRIGEAPREGEPPSGHYQRFRGAVDRAEAAAQQLRHQAMAQNQLRQEWSSAQSKEGSIQRYLRLLGQNLMESAAVAAAAANEAADGISAQARQMEEVYRARSAELDASKEQFLQDTAQRKISQARAQDGGAEPEPEPSAGGSPNPPAYDAVNGMSVRELREVIARAGMSSADCVEKPELCQRAREALAATEASSPAAAAPAALKQPEAQPQPQLGPEPGLDTPPQDASLDQKFQRWCGQIIEMQQRYDAVMVESVERGHRHRQAAMVKQRVESSKMLSSAVQQFSSRSAAGGIMAGGVAEQIRAEAQAAEQQAEAAAVALRAQVGAQKVVDVAFLSARNEDVADREPVPMHFYLNADFATWEGRKDAFLAQLAQRLGVPPGGISITNVRAGSIYVDVNVALPPGMALAEFIDRAQREAAQADEDIRHVLLGNYDLDLPDDTMDPRWNKEYGPGQTIWAGASPGDQKDRGTHIIVSNGLSRPHRRRRKVTFSYHCPVGWTRYGLQISKDFDREYKGWPVAYHGTATSSASAILNTALRQSGGAAGGCAVFGDGVYLTPSIRYAAWSRYAKWYGPIPNGPSRGHYVQMAFQCRVNPRHIKTVAQQSCLTVNGVDHPLRGNTIDPNIDNADMEWIVPPNGRSPHGPLFVGDDQVVCYGIMLRVLAELPIDPNDLASDPEYYPGRLRRGGARRRA
eukprot:COSAG01_NODE_3185_length_6428_cov_3.036722_6_plen_882_part_00